MEGQWSEGAIGFKAFMPISDPSYPNVTDAEFLEGMRTAAALGALVLVHAESDSMLRRTSRGCARPAAATRWPTPSRGRRSPRRRPPTARSISPAHAGARLQVVHTSSPVTVDLVARGARGRAARDRRGLPAPPAARPRRLRARSARWPAARRRLRDRALVEGMWERVLAGGVDCLVSDHAAYTREEKERGYEDIFETPLGCQVIQETVPAVLSEAFHRRGMPLDAFARFSLDQRRADRRACTRARARSCPAPTPIS